MPRHACCISQGMLESSRIVVRRAAVAPVWVCFPRHHSEWHVIGVIFGARGVVLLRGRRGMAAVQFVLHQVRHRPEALCSRPAPRVDAITYLCQPTRFCCRFDCFKEARLLWEDMLSTIEVRLLLLSATWAMGCVELSGSIDANPMRNGNAVVAVGS